MPISLTQNVLGSKKKKTVEATDRGREVEKEKENERD